MHSAVSEPVEKPTGVLYLFKRECDGGLRIGPLSILGLSFRMRFGRDFVAHWLLSIPQGRLLCGVRG